MNKNKVIFASIFGNALEFYDFTLYAAFNQIIAHTYFPPTTKFNETLLGLGVFAAGFLMRPFGAFVFGYIGDRYGRKLALMLAILLMGIPTLLIGIMPSFASIGWIATITIIISRLLQGLCTGGEYNGAAIFALEHVGINSPGLTGGLITASAGLGALLASGIALLLTHALFPEWSWRGAFVLGTVASLWGWYVRTRLEESPAFKEIQAKDQVVKAPLMRVLKTQKMPALITMIFGAFDGVLSYIVFVFLGIFLETFTQATAFQARTSTLISILSFTFFSPVMGHFLDRFKDKPFLSTASLSVLVLAFPAFWLMTHQTWSTILLGSVLFGALAASIAGAQHAFVQKLFPTEDRYSGIAFNFSVGMSIGGATPYILTKILAYKTDIFLLSAYVMAWAVLCFWAVRRAKIRS